MKSISNIAGITNGDAQRGYVAFLQEKYNYTADQAKGKAMKGVASEDYDAFLATYNICGGYDSESSGGGIIVTRTSDGNAHARNIKGIETIDGEDYYLWEDTQGPGSPSSGYIKVSDSSIISTYQKTPSSGDSGSTSDNPCGTSGN